MLQNPLTLFLPHWLVANAETWWRNAETFYFLKFLSNTMKSRDSFTWTVTNNLEAIQSFASITVWRGLATPLSLTSVSLVSNSHALGGTSTAGEQLKNPCGCIYKPRQTQIDTRYLHKKQKCFCMSQKFQCHIKLYISYVRVGYLNWCYHNKSYITKSIINQASTPELSNQIEFVSKTLCNYCRSAKHIFTRIIQKQYTDYAL